MQRRSLIVLILVPALVAMAAGACGTAPTQDGPIDTSGESEQAPEQLPEAPGTMTLTLSLSGPPDLNQLSHIVAQDLGWFEEAGLEVEEIYVRSDADNTRVLLSGDSDIGSIGNFTLFGALLEGARIKAVGSLQPLVDYQLIARPEIKTFADMEGARIAAAGPGGLTEFIPKMMMTKYGLDPSQAELIAIGGHDARLQAIAANQADIGIVGVFYAALAQEMADVHVLASIPEEFPGLGFVYLTTSERALNDPAKRRAIQKYIELAAIRGARFIMENPERAAEIMHEREPELDKEVLRSSIEILNENEIWPVNGGADPEVTEFSIKTALDLGIISGELSVEDVLDTTLVDELLNEQGKW